MYLSSPPLIIPVSQAPNRKNTLLHSITNQRIFKLREHGPEIFWRILENMIKAIS